MAIYVFVAEKPESDNIISKWEVKYIQESRGNITFEKLQIPWRSIFSSTAVFAILAAHFSENWGHYTFLTQLPMYLNGTDHFVCDVENVIDFILKIIHFRCPQI